MAAVCGDVSRSAPVKINIFQCINCLKCNKVVRNGILCDFCGHWQHFRWAKISENEIKGYKSSEWKCPVCVEGNVSALITPKTETNIGNVHSLRTIIHSLKEENQTLIDEIRNLKKNWTSSDYQLSRKISEQEIIDGHDISLSFFFF